MKLDHHDFVQLSIIVMSSIQIGMMLERSEHIGWNSRRIGILAASALTVVAAIGIIAMRAVKKARLNAPTPST